LWVSQKKNPALGGVRIRYVRLLLVDYDRFGARIGIDGCLRGQDGEYLVRSDNATANAHAQIEAAHPLLID
jgi:hypothetical protein